MSAGPSSAGVGRSESVCPSGPRYPRGDRGTYCCGVRRTLLPARTRLAAGIGERRLRSVPATRSGRGLGGRRPGHPGGRPRRPRRLAAGHPVALVSGTNGKTTTTSLLRAGPGDRRPRGHQRPRRQPAARPGRRPGRRRAPDAAAALEVDEAWLGRVVDATAPRAVALLNLSRDQLDRNNEVRQLAAAWRRTFGRDGPTPWSSPTPTTRSSSGGPARPPEVRWVGAGQPWTLDASGCPRCGGRIRFGEGGDWSCGQCDLRRPRLDVCLDKTTVVGPHEQRTPLELSLPGRANRANAMMALTVAGLLGADWRRAADGHGRGGRGGGPVRHAFGSPGAKPACCWPRTRPAGWRCSTSCVRPLFRSWSSSTPASRTAGIRRGCGTCRSSDSAAGS